MGKGSLEHRDTQKRDAQGRRGVKVTLEAETGVTCPQAEKQTGSPKKQGLASKNNQEW